MPFSIQSRLIEFDYLGSDDGSIQDLEYQEMARDYRKEIDFAFFVTNFNYSKADFEELTPKEVLFIMKAWETKLVSDTTHLRNATLNAIGNAMRKKNKKFTDLWNKKRKKLDMEYAKANLEGVIKLENEQGKSWVDKIYRVNGLKRPQRRRRL